MVTRVHTELTRALALPEVRAKFTNVGAEIGGMLPDQFIVGMNIAEGRLLLAELLERATQRELVYRHHWQAGDLVIYDNRCTLHRGLRYDVTQRRELRRITTEDSQGAAVAQAA